MQTEFLKKYTVYAQLSGYWIVNIWYDKIDYNNNKYPGWQKGIS